MACRFVQPIVVRLPLTEGDWVDVKRDLTFGEQQQMFSAMRRRYAPGELPMLDPASVTSARVLAYVVSWSLVDSHGTPVALSPGALNSLFPDAVNEIRDALDAHVDARERELADEKKTTRSGATTSGPALVSVS
jgi:hypothetical protein